MNNFVELLKDETVSSELANVLQNSENNADYVSIITKFASEHGVAINDDEVKSIMNKVPLPESFMDELQVELDTLLQAQEVHELKEVGPI